MRDITEYSFRYPDYRSGVRKYTSNVYKKVQINTGTEDDPVEVEFIPKVSSNSGIVIQVRSSVPFNLSITSDATGHNRNATVVNTDDDGWFFVPNGHEVFAARISGTTLVSVDGWNRDS